MEVELTGWEGRCGVGGRLILTIEQGWIDEKGKRG